MKIASQFYFEKHMRGLFTKTKHSVFTTAHNVMIDAI